MKPFLTERFSIIGDRHHTDGGDCQDSANTVETDELCILLVSDGVSSNKDSKVGSLLITQIARRLILRSSSTLSELCRSGSDGELLCSAKLFTSRLNSELREELSATGRFLSDYPEKENPLAATLLGCVITPKAWFVFGCGDGVVLVNERLYVIEGKEAHLPNLLAESLPAGVPEEDCQSQGHIELLSCGLTDTLETVLLGTDGALELLPLVAQGRSITRIPRLARMVMFAHDDITIVSARRASP